MSYDITIRSKHFCPHCGRDSTREEDQYHGNLPSPTYNLTPIFDLALTGEPLPNPQVPEGRVVVFGEKTERPRGLRVLSGRTMKDSIPMLEKALQRIADDRSRFVALEPSNGWGDLKGAVWVLNEMIEAARKCRPEATWDIC